MQFGSAGAGSATHLGCVVLNTAMGTNIVHVPYKGTGPAMQDLIAGRIDFLCEVISTAKPQIDGGTVKAIAIMTKTRSPVEPNLATSLEQGFDVQAYTWNALFLPKGAPAAVVKKLNGAMIAGDEDAGRAREAGRLRRAGRLGRSRHARLSRRVRQERDREVGGADQGERRAGELKILNDECDNGRGHTRPFFLGLPAPNGSAIRP